MKQQFDIFRYPILWVVFLLLFFTSQSLCAQEEGTLRDSIRIKPPGGYETTINLLPEKTEFLLNPDPPRQLERRKLPSFSFREELHLPYHVDRSPLHRGDFTTSGVLWQHRRGAIFGTGEQTTVPGIGRFNEASLGYGHVFNDRLSLQVSVDAMKINRINFVGETFGTSGRMSYQASDRLAFNVFGSYQLGNTYGMSTDSYGATVSVVMSDRFRMEVGAQRVYNAARGQWETVPVAIPTYRFNNGFELGLDVGGIIYEILRSTVFDSNQRNSGPTIAPPRLNMPVR